MSRLGPRSAVGVEKLASDEHGRRLVYGEHFADCYAEGRGRSSVNPELPRRLGELTFLVWVLRPEGTPPRFQRPPLQRDGE